MYYTHTLPSYRQWENPVTISPVTILVVMRASVSHERILIVCTPD